MIRDSPAFTAQPVGFEPVRIPQSAIRNGAVNGLALWRPVPPRGFVALGLVASVININSQTEVNSQTETHPPPNADCVRCVRSELCVLFRRRRFQQSYAALSGHDTA